MHWWVRQLGLLLVVQWVQESAKYWVGCRLLKELNIKVPQQLSIMGYSNFPGSQLMIPALSTIDIHLRECGQMALEQLLQADQWFRRGTTPPEIFTPYEIILRESIRS